MLAKQRRHSILIFLFLGTVLCFAQKEPQYTQYMYNIGSFNPAYVGSVEKMEISALYRAQWIDIPGAPKTLRLGLNLPMANGKNGIGFNVVSDQLGPTSQTFIDAAYSFQVNVSEETKLSFGIDVGGSFLNVDFSKGDFEQQAEPLLGSNVVNKFYPSVGAGMFLYSGDGYLGASVPNLLTNVIDDPEVQVLVNNQTQFNFIGGYVFELSDNLKFKPAFLANYLKGLPVKLDLSTNFLLKDVLTIGASYRVNNAVSGLVGYQISSGMFFGYAYDYNTNGLSGYNSGSHEAIIKFYIGDGTRNNNRNVRGARDKNMKGKPTQIDSPRFF